MNVSDPEERRKLTLHEAFRLPGRNDGTGSRVANFQPSTDPVRINGGRKRTSYTPAEQRRRNARKGRRIQERIAAGERTKKAA